MRKYNQIEIRQAIEEGRSTNEIVKDFDVKSTHVYYLRKKKGEIKNYGISLAPDDMRWNLPPRLW